MTQLAWFTVLNIYLSSSNGYIESEKQNNTYRTKKSFTQICKTQDLILLYLSSAHKRWKREHESMTVIKPFFIKAAWTHGPATLKLPQPPSHPHPPSLSLPVSVYLSPPEWSEVRCRCSALPVNLSTFPKRPISNRLWSTPYVHTCT